MALKTSVKPAPKPAVKAKAATPKPPAPTKAAAATKTAARPKAATTPKAKAAAPVITLKQLAAALADRQEMAPKQASLLLGSLVELVVEHLKQGDRLRIGGLGVLEVKSRPARMGRNPATGAAIQIQASKKIAFRAAKELKDAV
jgi:DNA-binding protein HU-beta